jgi:hypothetical protein
MAAEPCHLAVIELRAYCRQPIARDAIGHAAVRGDEPAPPQLVEDREVAVAEYPALAVQAQDLDDFVLVVLPISDVTALR